MTIISLDWRIVYLRRMQKIYYVHNLRIVSIVYIYYVLWYH